MERKRRKNMQQIVEQATQNMPIIKRVKVSSKRQISIPKEFYEAMNLEQEAIIEFNGTSLTIRQVPEAAVDLSSEILKDLIDEGLSGDKLFVEFNRIKNGLPAAIEKLKKEAKENPAISDNTEDYLASLLAEEE